MRLALTLVCLLFVPAVAQRAKTNKPKPNPSPIISSFESSAKSLALCGAPVPGETRMLCYRNKRTSVTLTVNATGQAEETLSYSYSTTAGEILGEGPRVTWNFENARHGKHTATVTVRNQRGTEASASTTVDIVMCESGCPAPEYLCPTLVVKSPNDVSHRAERSFFEVTIHGDFLDRPDYIWSVTGGRIVKGQHTPHIEVLVTGEIGSEVTATVKVIGFDASCGGNSASQALPITP